MDTNYACRIACHKCKAAAPAHIAQLAFAAATDAVSGKGAAEAQGATQGASASVREDPVVTLGVEANDILWEGLKGSLPAAKRAIVEERRKARADPLVRATETKREQDDCAERLQRAVSTLDKAKEAAENAMNRVIEAQEFVSKCQAELRDSTTKHQTAVQSTVGAGAAQGSPAEAVLRTARSLDLKVEGMDVLVAALDKVIGALPVAPPAAVPALQVQAPAGATYATVVATGGRDMGLAGYMEVDPVQAAAQAAATAAAAHEAAVKEATDWADGMRTKMLEKYPDAAGIMDEVQSYVCKRQKRGGGAGPYDRGGGTAAPSSG